MAHIQQIHSGAENTQALRVYLTPRERQVLALLCEGLPNKLIARSLDISVSTVKVHISNILRELGVTSRLQAVVAARRLRDMSEVHDEVGIATFSQPLSHTLPRAAA